MRHAQRRRPAATASAVAGGIDLRRVLTDAFESAWRRVGSKTYDGWSRTGMLARLAWLRDLPGDARVEVADSVIETLPDDQLRSLIRDVETLSVIVTR